MFYYSELGSSQVTQILEGKLSPISNLNPVQTKVVPCWLLTPNSIGKVLSMVLKIYAGAWGGGSVLQNTSCSCSSMMPSTHSPQSSVTPVPGDSTPSSSLRGYQAHLQNAYIWMQAKHPNTYFYNEYKKFIMNQDSIGDTRKSATRKVGCGLRNGVTSMQERGCGKLFKDG